MKKLYTIFVIFMLGYFGFLFAADFDVSIGPDNQTAISGTVLNFSMSGINNTGFDSYLSLSFSNLDIEYLNADIAPINTPAIALGLNQDPRWELDSGQSLSLDIQVRVLSGEFNILNLSSIISDINNTANIYTSSVVSVLPISDIVINKTIDSIFPQLTGDIVDYSIEVKNIGSKMATGIKLVDIWPDDVLTFANQGIINGSFQVPIIYNGIANNYLFSLNNLLPGESIVVNLTGSFDNMQSPGQLFENEAFVLVDSLQYDISNDTSFVTGYILGVPDLILSILQLGSNPSISGDLISYQISYQNIGTDLASGILLSGTLDNSISFLTSSITPLTQNNNNISWNLGNLMSGDSGNVVITGIYQGGLNVGDIILNNFELYFTGFETDTTNNKSLITGGIDPISDLSVKLYATNLSNNNYNTDLDLGILAVSGDLVQLEIVLVNSGNIFETGDISISNLNGFVGYNNQTSWNTNIPPYSVERIILTGIVGPKNFVSFGPIANLSYNGLFDQDNVIIEEPLECGDGLITQNEQCDINGQIGVFLPGQQCEEENGQCILVTENITNNVCLSYSTDLGTGKQCMSVTVQYDEEELGAQCDSLNSPYGVVIVDQDNEGDMDFTCVAQDGVIADEIRIDCGNGDEGIAYATSSFTYNCEYEYDNDGVINDNIYSVQCYVDDDTNQNCLKNTRVDQGFYGVCGDGTLDDGEDCDLGGDEDEKIKIGRYLDLDRDYSAGIYSNDGYYCEDCRIKQNEQFIYQIPQCLGTNTTISVMENEYLPFRWRLRERDNLRIRDNYDCEDRNNNQTIIDKDSMKCNFVIYNHDDEVGRLSDADCFSWSDSQLFDYFELEDYNIDFDKVSGRYVYSIDSLFDRAVKEYGEYKLVLEKVEYDYCNSQNGDWEKGRLYEGVCEVNFALTRPYMMQISTFGVQPVATDADFLEDFYDMEGNSLIESTDIRNTMEVEQRDYGFDSSVINQMDTFKNKYKGLAILVDNNFEIRNGKTIGDLFNNGEVKKVPNKMIFFVEGNGTLTLRQLTEYFPGVPFTIYIEGMDVIVEGSVQTNGMIITNQKIYFEDSSDLNYCEKGGQIVKGIFVAKGGFDSDTRLRNQKIDQQRCPWGSLQVKGVLIGDNLEKLMNNRRSHLNDWFQVDSNIESVVKRERRNEIFEGAALLIEYNPDLWENLPPGAESFTKYLEVYKK